ncbi:MAG: undecaprenyldiphospho-muramoylpentapeptide beta-N-acetylglucosaminyltransferase [Aquamicrobium sp.]|uniref:undecaprenyldiphospho-muramoylpentapeptide beta-N-acetylglucosaminyltransferase n=1 Tax=Aquamicrobium sp. TaxID=1872579 RepID=UPI00349E9C85|nr:undecaprenyldiphospho-muramoylpentapeptide beta-N-acetylglucosaminyltransferase [Aquamicrobium sp.]
MAKGAILLAAGGTGGHLFPAEALAHELVARGWDVHLATDTRAGRYAGSFPAAAIHEIPSATIGSKNPLALIRAFWTIWRGAREAGRVIGEIGPKAVIGFGGYPTLPPVWAATRRGVPTIIHEQNAVMGRANKALAPRVTAIAGGFLPEGEGAHAGKTVATGNPVRPAVIEAAGIAYEQSGDGEPFRLLVFGGSQGAQFFSQAVPAAIALLPADMRARLTVTQQARAEDEAAVKAAYAGLGIAAEVSPFFTDMARRIAGAHLVISRSGASTVSEIAAIGRPAILVPYPHALDHDQAANAAALARAGGAEVCVQSSLSPEVLASKLTDYMRETQLCTDMAEAAKSVGKPEATRLLGDLAEAIASGQSVAQFKERMQA